MSEEPEKFTYQTVVSVVDADGKAIREGSVLRHTRDGARGVVVNIVRNCGTGPLFSAVGDLVLSQSPSQTRVTNQYALWRHIPHDEQTYQERLTSWLASPSPPIFSECASADTNRAISGIIALLPENAVNWDFGPFPDTIEEAMRYLAAHLTSLQRQTNPGNPA